MDRVIPELYGIERPAGSKILWVALDTPGDDDRLTAKEEMIEGLAVDAATI
jgi:hypothetical protein